MTDFDPSRRFFTFYQAPAILASVVIAPVAVESALGTLEEVLAGDGEVADLAEIERAISTPVEVQLPASDPRITYLPSWKEYCETHESANRWLDPDSTPQDIEGMWPKEIQNPLLREYVRYIRGDLKADYEQILNKNSKEEGHIKPAIILVLTDPDTPNIRRGSRGLAAAISPLIEKQGNEIDIYVHMMDFKNVTNTNQDGLLEKLLPQYPRGEIPRIHAFETYKDSSGTYRRRLSASRIDGGIVDPAQFNDYQTKIIQILDSLLPPKEISGRHNR